MARKARPGPSARPDRRPQGGANPLRAHRPSPSNQRQPENRIFLELRKHWSDEQVVEIVAVIAMFGFLNRWNDTFATPLEDAPLHFGETHLTAQGWDAGKHLR